MRKPRVAIYNHRGRDEQTSSELNMPWEKAKVINDALGHIKRTCNVVPDSVATVNQLSTVKRALGQLRQEVDVAMKLLLEK
jgi:hypothetical protein